MSRKSRRKQTEEGAPSELPKGGTPQEPMEAPEALESRPSDADADRKGREYSAEEIAQLEQKASERDEYLDKWRRKAADYVNRERRFARELEETRTYALQKFVSDLFPVMDNFERALDAARESHDFDVLLEGVELTYRELLAILAAAGIKRMEPEGKPFDPRYHEAMAQLERDDVPDGTVIEVFQPGYTLHGRVARHARVVVSRAPAGKDEPESAEADEADGEAPRERPEGD